MAYIDVNQLNVNAILQKLKNWVWAVQKNLYFYQTKNPVAAQEKQT